MTRTHVRDRLIDDTPVGLVSTKDLVRRIASLDDELSVLLSDSVHVNSTCIGAELFFHRKQIAKERAEARSRRDTYVAELEKRTP